MPIPRGGSSSARVIMKNFDDPMAYTSNVSVSSEFSNRQRSLFNVLRTAENDRKEMYGSKPPDPSSVEHCRNVRSEVVRSRIHARQFVGQESIFKKPAFRPPNSHRRRAIPDHQLNPEKWTKYSLADVTQSQMSDQCNAATAFSFLRELEDRKKKQEDAQESVDLDNARIVFQRVSETDCASSSSEVPSKPAICFSKSKVVMPEYVVGQKKSNKNKRRRVAGTSESESAQKSVKLDHLMEEEDE